MEKSLLGLKLLNQLNLGWFLVLNVAAAAVSKEMGAKREG